MPAAKPIPSFEELPEDAQSSLLSLRPDFHSLSEHEKPRIIKNHLAVLKKKAARAEVSGAKAVEEGTKKLAAIKASSQKIQKAAPAASDATKAVRKKASKPIVNGQSYLDYEGNTAESIYGKHETLSHYDLDPANPAAANAVDYNPDYGDLMHEIGQRLEAHRIHLEGASEDVSDIGTHITDGFEALQNHVDAHLHGGLEAAKMHIKSAAEHFSKAASALNAKYGQLPKVGLAGTPKEYAMPLGDLAVSVSNNYIRAHSGDDWDDFKDTGSKYKGIQGRLKKLGKLSNPYVNGRKKVEEPEVPTGQNAADLLAKARQQWQAQADRRVATNVKPVLSREERQNAIKDRIVANATSDEVKISTPMAREATAAPSAEPVIGVGRRQAGKYGKYSVNRSTGRTRVTVSPENRAAFISLVHEANGHLQSHGFVPKSIREDLGEVAHAEVVRVHRERLSAEQALAEEKFDSTPIQPTEEQVAASREFFKEPSTTKRNDAFAAGRGQ